MKLPERSLAIAINRAIRRNDEWFEEPDDLPRLDRALESIHGIGDPIDVAAVLIYRVARAQSFTEGNKRTALLLARWVLDRNGEDGARILPPEDREVADLLVKAAMQFDVEADLLDLLRSRA